MLAYNITVQCEDVSNFLGHELGSIDHLDPNLFSSADPTTAVDLSQETYRFLVYLNVASRADAGLESFIVELTKVFLKLRVSIREAQSSTLDAIFLLPSVGIVIKLPDWACVLFALTP